MNTSGVSLKEYWKDYNILKATDNIIMAWEEITVLCMKGEWHKFGLTMGIMVQIVIIWIC